MRYHHHHFKAKHGGRERDVGQTQEPISRVTGAKRCVSGRTFRRGSWGPISPKYIYEGFVINRRTMTLELFNRENVIDFNF